ncbi:hypothetical protein [Listeria ivanovii]|uniref:hypothetical protein n=3 Tax=Listeria ivanovii TaxID=1638 RepID=UPI0005127F12|nr:hypothetical protein [Listeria ivanovii]AIS63970.1 hypothetical protein JL53_01155 [Listeria ivanovii subsp. londoniensis]MBK1966090.1 hypothetical protein [Listeria ivanovii subsp. londoniensis]MBK1985386.1 hypothetical protein [Listeria ivanovii subsp. londoniensis]MBK1996770.1 hypothetical protein [Listeria ivanovii subsp. londoniensis]MBK2003173.1 hypothetical protein [Listeria ivanovii subsp. londoniensis]
MQKSKIIVALIVMTSCIIPATVFADIKDPNTDLKIVFEKEEIKNEDKLLDLAAKQENQEYIVAAGEKIPIAINDSSAEVATDALPDVEEELNTKVATEVLEVRADEKGDYEADLVSTIFVEVEGDGVISADLVDEDKLDETEGIQIEKQSTKINSFSNFLVPMAAWTDTSSTGKKGAKDSIYISAKVYYHQQKKSGNTHMDMNTINYNTSVKKTGGKITRRTAKVAQSGMTKFGKKPLLQQTKSLSFSGNSYKYDVPDSWTPISTTNGWVGTQLNVASTYKGSTYNTSVNCLILSNPKLGW